MPLIYTPRHFALRAHFYQQFGQLLSAGLPLINTLETLERNPPAQSYHAPLRKMIEHLKEGNTVSEAVQGLGHWMPAFDIALVQAGEQSGRLDVVFKQLAEYYNERAILLRRSLSDLAYPALILHMAIFIFPLIDYVRTGNGKMFLLKTIGVLIPMYLAILFMIKAMQSRRSASWRAFVEKVLRPVPVLGSARQNMALSRLAATLEALLNAGVNIIQAWELAAEASGSPALLTTVAGWRPRLEGGQTPSEIVSASRQFPELFANFYHSGEVSGQLDDTLRRVRDYYREQGSNQYQLLAQWVPRLVYFCVAGYAAYKIIGFYTGYFNMIKQITG